MSAGPWSTADGALYRAALLLCPGGFRRDHGEEMARDFDEARSEAAHVGGGAMWMLRLAIALDLVRTILVQWLRTRLPAIAAAAIVVSLGLTEGLATVARQAAVRVPADLVESEIFGVLLLALVAVMTIGLTIALTVYATWPRHARRR